MTSPSDIPSREARGSTQSLFAITSTLLLVVLYTLVRLWHATDSCLWFDEVFSIHATRHSWGEMLNFVAADLIHPPLFYALLKVWIAIGGETLAWLRLLPIVLSLLALAPFFLLARELGLSLRERNLALLFLTVNGYLIKYAQEVRMYSLLLLLSLCSLWLFVRLIRSRQSKIGGLLWLVLINLLLIYTHYYGWLLIVTEMTYVLFTRREKIGRLLTATLALLLSFGPWVYACVLRSADGAGLSQNIGWQARPRLPELWQLLALFHQPFYFQQSNVAPSFAVVGALIGFVLITVPILVLVVRQSSGSSLRDTGSTRLLIFFSTVPVVLAFALSYVLPFSIWGTRHLIVCIVPYTILGAIAIVRLNETASSWVRLGVAVILGCWFFVAALNFVVQRPTRYIWCAWEDLALLAAKEGSTGSATTIYAFEDLIAYQLWFAGRSSVAVVKNVPGIAEDRAYFLPRRFADVKVRDIDSITDERLIIAFRDLSLDRTRPPLNVLEARGYVIERVFETTAQGQRAFLIVMVRNA